MERLLERRLIAFLNDCRRRSRHTSLFCLSVVKRTGRVLRKQGNRRSVTCGHNNHYPINSREQKRIYNNYTSNEQGTHVLPRLTRVVLMVALCLHFPLGIVLYPLALDRLR